MYQSALSTIIILVFGVCFLETNGQGITHVERQFDSIPGYTDLDETIVHGKKTLTVANKVTVLPNKKELNASIDAFSLIQRLTIPNVIVGENTISTVTGRDVTLFINGIPASQDDVKGVNVKNITKVEYIAFPQDTKYFGAQHVIDIITKEPEYGGFTKITPSAYFFAKGIYSTDVSSKFVYKRMMYDFVGSQFFFESDKVGQDINQRILLKNKIPFTQNQRTSNSYQRDENYKGFFRVIYSAPNIVISNKVGFVYKSIPKQFETIQLSYPEQNGEILNYSYLNSHTLSPSWSGNINLNLPKDFNLSYKGDFTYSHNNYNNKKSSVNLLLYDNRVKEDVYRCSSDISVGKNFNKAGSLILSIYYYITNYNTRYNQKNLFTTQLQTSQGINPSVFYGLSLSNFMFQMQLGGQFLRNNVAGIIDSSFTPHVNINGYWSKNKHSAQINLMLTEVNYGGAMMNPNLLQIDNLIYAKGNPELKVSPYYSVDWYYIYQLSNTLHISTMGNCNYWQRNATIKYLPESDYIIQTRINSGNFYSGNASLRLTWRSLNGSLVIDAMPQILFSSVRGHNCQSIGCGTGSASITYYLKNWNFMIYYNADRKQTDNSGIVTYSPSVYGFKVGWGNENWKILFDLHNPFRNSWKYSTQSYTSDVYSYTNRLLGEEQSHRIFSFSFAYIINYGKKTSRETLQGTDTSSSAILH